MDKRFFLLLTSLLLVLLPQSAISTETRSGEGPTSEVLPTQRSDCQVHFDENQCQAVIDREGGPRSSFLDCSRTNFERLQSCGVTAGVSTAVSFAVPAWISAAAGRIILPMIPVIAGAAILDRLTQPEQACYDNPAYKRALLMPMAVYFVETDEQIENFLNSKMHLPCLTLEQDMRRFKRRVEGEIFTKNLERERYERIIDGREEEAEFVERVNRRIPPESRELTAGEQRFQSAVQQITDEQLAAVRASQEYIRTNPCRSWEHYAQIMCGIGGGVAGGVTKNVIQNRVAASAASRASLAGSLNPSDDWINANLTRDGRATWRNVLELSSRIPESSRESLRSTLAGLLARAREEGTGSSSYANRFGNILTSLENSLMNMTRAAPGSAEFRLGQTRLNQKLALINESLRLGQDSARGWMSSLLERLRPLNPEMTEARLQTCLFGQTCALPRIITVDDVVAGARQQRTTGDAVEFASAQFRGVAYGEQAHVRNGVFCGRVNCTTYAERVTAIVRSERGEDFASSLNFVRYQGRDPSHHMYTHMPSLWLRNSQANGITRDITREIGGDSTRSITRAIDQGAFLRSGYQRQIAGGGLNLQQTTQARANAISVADELAAVPALRPQSVTLPYVPAERLLADPAMVARIPTGSRFSVVVDSNRMVNGAGQNFRQQFGSDLMVTHTGFVIRRNGQTYVRHASSLFDGQVREDPIEEYVRKYIAEHPARLGLHLEEVLPLP